MSPRKVTSDATLTLPEGVSHDVAIVSNAATNCKVTNQEGYERAGKLVVEIGTAITRAEEQRKSFTRPLDELKKRWMDLFAGPINEMKLAKSEVDRAMLAYRHRLEEEARQRAEEEARLQREQEAKQLKKAGEKEAAKELLKAPLVIAPVVVDAPKVAGVMVRKIWTFEVVDASLLPRQYLIPDDYQLDCVAKAQKENAVVPGVRFYFTESVGRTGR